MQYLDFGLSYAKNGELLKYIRKIGSFDETCTRFYTAEMVSALEYLHGRGIIHRYQPEDWGSAFRSGADVVYLMEGGMPHEN